MSKMGKSPQERARDRAMMQSATPRYIPLPIVRPLDGQTARRAGDTVTGVVVGYQIYDPVKNVVKGFAGFDLETASLACEEAEAADAAATPDGSV